MKKIVNKIFEKWSSELKDRDLKKDSVFANFDDLFFEMKKNFVLPEEAHDYIKPAVAKHLPNKGVVNAVYNRTKGVHKLSEHDFFSSWSDSIMDSAVKAYYNNYPIDAENKNVGRDLDLPLNMSREEYSRQRKHVNQFPLVDLDILDRMYKEIDPKDVISFDEMLGDFKHEQTLSREDK